MLRRVFATRFALLCLTVPCFVGCTQEPAPTDAAANEAARASRLRDGPPALQEAQLPDFVGLIERLVNGAAERVITGGSSEAVPESARLKPPPGRRVPDAEPLDREFSVTAAGQTGRVQAYGLAFTRPWPSRYDMSLELEGFSHEPELSAQGAVQYNFIRDDRAAPAANHGLFRARLTLGGSFEGDVDLHGEIASGRIVSLVVLTGRERMLFGGREPRPFVSYVSTVVGTGERGNSDGKAAEATFNQPSGLLVDRTGRMFIADTGNNAVRVVAPDGDVTTLSTAFVEPWDLGMDGLGLLVVSDRAASTAAGFGPISRVITGGLLEGTVIRTVGASGRGSNGFPYCGSYSCDGRTPLAQMQWAGGIDVEGAVVTLAQWALPLGLRVVTPDGSVMTLRSWGQGGTSCTAPTIGAPHDVVGGTKGELYFTTDCNAVWTLKPNGEIEVLAGGGAPELGFADGVGADARFSYPSGLVTDGEFLYLTEWSGELLRRVDLRNGETVRIAGCLPNREDFDCSGPRGLGDGPGDSALFHGPRNLALDPWGDLYVADTNNHTIRLVRMANDPERRPVIENLQPLALQQGAEATLTIRGRDLSLAREVDLGDGITTEILERGAKKLKVRVAVAESAASGARALSVTTAFGRTTTPDGMTFSVLDERASRVRVTTLSGTGDWTPSLNGIVPAEHATYAFPGGIAAIDKDRLLVADPLENRIRLITTKDGAAEELLELAVYEAGGTLGLEILQGLEGLEKIAGNLLGAFGLDNFAAVPREELLGAIGDGLDEICEAYGSACEHMVLPWAGVAGAGDSGGFRLNARLFLPNDVAVLGDGTFVIADTGNARLKTVGIDFSGPEPQPAPYEVANTDRFWTYPLAVAGTASDTAIAATATDATLAKVTLRDGSSVLSDFAGVKDAFRCERGDDDVRHPMGIPIGIATGKSGTFIADPFCKTIWKLEANGEVADIRGELEVDLSAIPPCSDGPLMFATFSRPMDLAIDSAGNIWVVDSGCNSVRVIKDLYQSSGAADTARRLGGWAERVNKWLDSEALASVSERLADPRLGEVDAARWWVVTVAGAADGEGGFRDGAASEALFNAPVAIALAEDDGETYVFVSDVGNKRIRLIDLNARAENTTRVPPADEVPPFELPGPDDEPLAPLDALNYLIAWVHQGKAAQVAADATDAILAMDDHYLAKGSGAAEGVNWELGLQITNVTPDVSLASPPGFTSASRDGFAMAAPLVGTWRAGFSADLIGKASVKSGDLTLFSWSPEVLDFGLGVRDLKVTADVDLDPTRVVPQLESATVHAQALLFGTGVLAFNRPVDLRASPRDGALELRGVLREERLDLGGLSARLNADLVLTLKPSTETVGVVAGPSDEPWIDEDIPTMLVTVAIDGELATELEGVVMRVPVSASFDISVPAPDALEVPLRALERPIPRIWGEGRAPAGFEIDPVMTRSPGEFAQVAAEVEAAFRRGHAPFGVVMSRVRPPPITEQPARTVASQLLRVQEPERPSLTQPLDQSPGAQAPDPAALAAAAARLRPPFPPATPAWHGEEDSAIWSGHYLAAAAYRYAAEPNADARAGVELALGGIEALFDVTDGAIAVAGDNRAPVRSKGILSRTLFANTAEFEGLDFADGPLTERECYYLKPDDGWRLDAADNSAVSSRVYPTAAEAFAQSPGRGRDSGGAAGGVAAARAVEAPAALQPVGRVRYGYGCSSDKPVSRDQYIGVMMGLTVANRLVDDPDVKARTARLLLLATDFLVDNAWNIHLPPEERIRTDFLGNFEKQLAILRIGKTLNPEKYAVLYDYVAQASELAWLPAWVGTMDIRLQYYKFNLLHSGLVAALLLEDDPALRANYLAILDLAWGQVGHHRNAYFDLLRVLVRTSAAERATLLAMDSAYDASDDDITLRQEIGMVLGEWIARRDVVRSADGLPFNRVPDEDFIADLWPNAVGEYIQIDGVSRVLALKALPVHKRPSRESMDFIWQRQPFEVAMGNEIDRTDTPTEAEILDVGQRGGAWREGPGVDYLIAYWLARYLDVIAPP